MSATMCPRLPGPLDKIENCKMDFCVYLLHVVISIMVIQCFFFKFPKNFPHHCRLLFFTSNIFVSLFFRVSEIKVVFTERFY